MKEYDSSLQTPDSKVYFFCSENESENIAAAQKLVSECENADVVVFSKNADLDSLDKKNVRVRFVDRDICAVLYHLFENPPERLRDKNGRINIFVSSLSEQNIALINTLVWYCQSEDSFLHIKVKCKADEWESFKKAFPEIADTSLVPDKGGISYLVERDNLPPAGFNGINITPADYETALSKEKLINYEAEKIAQRIFSLWSNGKGDFWAKRSDYHTSVMSALFWLGRKHSGKSIEITEQNMHLEHKRWNAYMRSLGYVTGKVRDNNVKTHPCLVSYDDLSDAEKMLDANPIKAVRGE